MLYIKTVLVKQKNILIVVSLAAIGASSIAIAGLYHPAIKSEQARNPDGSLTLTASRHTDNSTRVLSAPTASNTPKPSAPAIAPVSSSLDSTGASSSPAPAIPVTQTLYSDPSANVSSQARLWANTHPNDAVKMDRIAGTPMANWFGGWSGDVATATANYVNNASAAGQVPVLVAYNIPGRDCGSYSAGGSSSADTYKSWITAFASGMGQRQAVVIVEPDALAGIDCLNSADQQSRLQLLSFAVQTLRSHTKAAIYLDAGNPTWQSVTTMATRLKSAGIAEATGFSLNVSNFQTTGANTSYGTSLSQQLSGKHFVIDTSRNGNGPASGDTAWCNPDGRAFGNTPTLQTGNGNIDAYLWIKSPGESDGSCGPMQQGTTAPTAGGWWPQYALMLATNSGW